MSAGTKKTVNRIGGVLLVVGVVLHVLTGGEASAAADIVSNVGMIAGTAAIIIRELLG